MFSNVCFNTRALTSGSVLLGMLIASCVSSSFAAAATVFCELASLPVLPLAADTTESVSPDELLERVAESYRGLLEFGGEAFTPDTASLEKLFDPVPGRDQRSVALDESLTKLGDWVMLESADFGLTPEAIVARLREVVRAHLRQTQEEQGRVRETREERSDPGRVTATGHLFYRDTRYPKLGEAWRDPSGMVWGDVVRDANGKALEMNWADAWKYCQEIGAELPSQGDFVRLREYMGAQPGTHRGYTPQILPGLDFLGVWSNSVADYDDPYDFYLCVGNGQLIKKYHKILMGVRCVVRP